ncbi:copper resistance protein CopC [Chloroflexales bacterium ZM16-3]|nr:copper resistance protein CopC [Chloroflexales bacterium ZM16-3]
MGALARGRAGRAQLSPAIWIIISALAALLSAGVAWAHPQILSMEPPPDARLKQPPDRLRITFNEPLESISSLSLRDSKGQEVASGGAPLPDEPTILAIEIPPLSPGVYTMVWTVVGDDGHIVKGNAAFTVLSNAASAGQPLAGTVTPAPKETIAPEPEPEPPPAPLPVAAILLRGLMLIGAATGVGGMAYLAWLLVPSMAGAGADTKALWRGRVWLAAPLLLCALAAALMLFVQADAALGHADLTSVWRLAGTRYGALLLIRAGLAIALATAVALPGHAGRLRGGVSTILGGLLLISFSLGGHAAAAASPLLPILADAVHLGVTTLWVGGLLAFALALPIALRATPEDRRPALLRGIFARFSAMAMASVALLTITGAYAALRLLGAISDLWTTPYGLALLAKLAAFAAMLLFGAYHLLVARPGLDAWASRAADAALAHPWPRMINRSLRAEATLGIIALLAAGALTSLAPPADTPTAAAAPLVPPTPTAIRVPTVTPGPTRTPVPSLPFDETQPAGDLRVRLEVSPASIGDDRFRVTVTDQNGQPVETQLVRLAFVMLEMDMGENQLVATPEAQASYTVSGAPMSMVGQWQITVTVRRTGLRDVQAIYTVPVGE